MSRVDERAADQRCACRGRIRRDVPMFTHHLPLMSGTMNRFNAPLIYRSISKSLPTRRPLTLSTILRCCDVVARTNI
jgi:hypothetical protein